MAGSSEAAVTHELPARPEHVHWGYLDAAIAPSLRIRSGDVVRVETIATQAGAHEGFMDDAVRAVYARVQDRGPGPHLLTGPIAVSGAVPGDALEVRVLDLKPRLPYGLCAQIPAGLFAEELGPGIVGTLFAIDSDTGSARAIERFTYPAPRPAPGEPIVAERYPALSGVSIPMRPHLGIAAVAPAAAGRVSSRSPGRFGGNLDQWRFTVGTAMTFPVLAPGALFSCGDGHLAQGDGEISGNGLESHLTATLQFSLHRARPLRNPRLETDSHWVLHGFGTTLEAAYRDAALEARELLGEHGLDATDAYTLMSLAVDLGVTQVVNGIVGAHALVAKELLPT